MGFVRRRTRRRTALMVGGAAFAAGAAGRAARRRGDPAYEEQAAPEPEQPAADTQVEELERLGALHKDGTLTDEEFAEAKAKLLGS